MLKLVVAAFVAVIATAGSFGIARVNAQVAVVAGPVGDHYLGYKVTVAASPAFVPDQVLLTNQLDAQKLYNVVKPLRLYNPAAKRITPVHTAGVLNPDLHYVGYEIALPDGVPPNTFDPGLMVQDQFGTFIVEARTAAMLLVPTAKKIGGAPEPLNQATDAANHYACYNVRVQQSYNSTGIFGLAVTIRDQFRQPRQFKVGAPTMLCNPAVKIHNQVPSPMVDPQLHLLCHKTKALVAFNPVGNIYTLNQMGPQKMRATEEVDFCVPAWKLHDTPMPPVTDPPIEPPPV